MSPRSVFISVLLAAAAASPVAALAAGNELRGRPQAFLVDPDTVRVQFATDQRVGERGARVGFSDRGSTTRVTPQGRHGEDFRYAARVQLRRDVEAGRRYTVTFRLADDDPISRVVLLREQR